MIVLTNIHIIVVLMTTFIVFRHYPSCCGKLLNQWRRQIVTRPCINWETLTSPPGAGMWKSTPGQVAVFVGITISGNILTLTDCEGELFSHQSGQYVNNKFNRYKIQTKIFQQQLWKTKFITKCVLVCFWAKLQNIKSSETYLVQPSAWMPVSTTRRQARSKLYE